MNPRTVAAVVAAFLFGSLAVFMSYRSVAGPSDIAVGEVVEYTDFYSCRLPDGVRAYEFHFGGKDRSHRNQLVLRVNNVGDRTMRVETNDATLPVGHIRLVRKSVVRRDLEGHNFGTDWSAEYLQINPRRPIERAVNIPPCGPER